MDVLQILQAAVERDASDVLISAGAPITYHVHGRLEPHDPDWVLTPRESEKIVYQMLRTEDSKTFEQEKELDLGFHVDGLSRFRVSVYRQRATVAAVLRLVPLSAPRYSDLGISDRLLMQMRNTPDGLILVTGPTGAGKSTTIASFLHYLNSEGDVPRHIITIEDPIEFILPSSVCVIDQRELGPDTKSYARGLRSALRQMPHVIFVGEMRDRETIEIALTAAETGNVVISTLSTQSAAKTINRIIDVFPVEQQSEIRTRLALTLRIVVSQVLLPREDQDGRIAAREIMFVNSAISNQIREGKVHQIPNSIAAGFREGMSLLDDSLLTLCEQGVIGPAAALARMQDPEKVRRLKVG